MMKLVAVAAIVAVSAAVDAQFFVSLDVNLAKENCPKYAARGDQCTDQNGCGEIGDRCDFLCSKANVREACLNATNCVPTRGGSSTSSQCTSKCNNLKSYEDCFTIGGCFFYDGQCQITPSNSRDAEACNAAVKATTDAGSVSITDRWDALPTPSNNNCGPKCNLAPSKISCDLLSSSYCGWDWVTNRCIPRCSAYNSFEMCNTVNSFGCRWHEGRCGLPCERLTSVGTCLASSCTWYKGKCQKRCDDIIIPGNGANYSSRLVCLNNPICGGESFCSAMNCSFLDGTSRRECEAENACRWVGTSDTNGYCTRPCASQWQEKRDCNVRGPNDQGPTICVRTQGGDGLLNGCDSAECGNYLGSYACLRAVTDCTWNPETSKCVAGSKACRSLQIETHDASRACNGTNYCRTATTGASNTQSCQPKCDRFTSENSCWAGSCAWHNGRCVTPCDSQTYNKTECESDDLRGHCQWVNHSAAYRGRVGCYVRCETLSDESCPSYEGHGCAVYGGISDYKVSECGCRQLCEHQPVGSCPSPCYRNSKLGGLCTSPTRYGAWSSCEIGLNAGEVAGAVIGAVAGVVLIGVVAFFCWKASSGAAAAGSSSMGAGATCPPRHDADDMNHA